ncbi:MAG: homocysteine S-methyltransferase family protein [Anaerolineaceae bacterium]|nr:homocysteine S-methyltransferase family protein [Anaerolineaceae bacterium]
MTTKTFLERLQTGEILVSDGATGTNLQKRGLPHGVTAEQWMLDQPNQIERLYRDFIQAGSDIILTCTFGGSSVRLEHTGMTGKTAEVNQQASLLARKAAEGTNVLIAGSIGPSGQMLKPLGPLAIDDAIKSFAEQAKALEEGGVDLLVIETQFDITEASSAIQGAQSVTKLPIVCSFSYDRGTRTMMGVKPAQMAKAIAPLGVVALGVNCGRSLEENLIVLQELKQNTDLPIWFKPNAGMPELDENDNPAYSVNPAQMGRNVPLWIETGARIIGGCCGNSPEHVQAIAEAVKAYKAS